MSRAAAAAAGPGCLAPWPPRNEADDPRKLAAIAWRLYGQVGVTQADIERLHGSLRSRSAGGGRPATIGGSPGPAAGR
jgi:hypothetical protein